MTSYVHVLWLVVTHVLLCRTSADTQQTDTHKQHTQHRHITLPFRLWLSLMIHDHTCIHVHVCVYEYGYMDMCMCVYMFMCMYMYLYLFLLCKCVYVYVCCVVLCRLVKTRQMVN